MKTSTILITAATTIALGVFPAIASAGSDLNHNEVLVTSNGA